MTDEVEEFVSRFPRKPTPSNSVEDLFEIQHTGEWNYQIEGGGTKIFIDGYRHRTILEAKYVNNPDRSPYIPNSQIPTFIRQKILKQIRDEFQRLANVIKDPITPFESLEVITNHLEAKALFEELLQEFNIVSNVVIRE